MVYIFAQELVPGDTISKDSSIAFVLTVIDLGEKTELHVYVKGGDLAQWIIRKSEKVTLLQEMPEDSDSVPLEPKQEYSQTPDSGYGLTEQPPLKKYGLRRRNAKNTANRRINARKVYA